MDLSDVHALFYEQLLLKLGYINPASSPNSFNLPWAEKITQHFSEYMKQL